MKDNYDTNIIPIKLYTPLLCTKISMSTVDACFHPHDVVRSTDTVKGLILALILIINVHFINIAGNTCLVRGGFFHTTSHPFLH